MRDFDLYVIGDSHTNFWNGSGDQDLPDTLPGVRSQAIPGATAYSLLSETSKTQGRNITLHAVRQAIDQGFTGWVMLNFGANDCNAWIWRQVPRLSLKDSIRVVVERYACFIREVRALYPKVAVFGPPAATKNDDTGTEVERNLAVIVFTAMLKERLLPEEIPVISMAEAMIAPDGTSVAHLYRDDKLHATQLLMPYALQLVNDALGIRVGIADDPLRMTNSRIRHFAAVEHCELMGRKWLRFSLRGGTQYIEEIGLWQQTFEQLGPIEFSLSPDRTNYTYYTLSDPSPSEAATKKRYIKVAQHASELLFSSPVRDLSAREIEIYAHSSQIAKFSRYSRDALFAIRDQILQVAPVRI